MRIIAFSVLFAVGALLSLPPVSHANPYLESIANASEEAVSVLCADREDHCPTTYERAAIENKAPRMVRSHPENTGEAIVAELESWFDADAPRSEYGTVNAYAHSHPSAMKLQETLKGRPCSDKSTPCLSNGEALYMREVRPRALALAEEGLSIEEITERLFEDLPQDLPGDYEPVSNILTDGKL